MSKPTEHKTVQARIRDHEEAGGWVFLFCVFRDTMAVNVSAKGVSATNPAILCRLKHVRVIS